MQRGQTADSNIIIELANLSQGVSGIEIHLTFDPNVVEVMDANTTQPGVQVYLYPLDTFFTGGIFVAQNRANNAIGTIDIAVSQSGGVPVTNGTVVVATVRWHGKENGCTQPAMGAGTQFSDSDGYPIVVTDFAPGDVCVTNESPPTPTPTVTPTFTPIPTPTPTSTPPPSSACKISGTVKMQGRTDHSGALLTAENADTGARPQVVLSDSDGNFEMSVDCGCRYSLIATMNGHYLTAQTAPQQVDQDTCVQTIKLAGGDVTTDDVIDIRDVAYIAYRFRKTDADALTADVTGDGKVDILDLTVTAANYGMIGPTNWPWC